MVEIDDAKRRFNIVTLQLLLGFIAFCLIYFRIKLHWEKKKKQKKVKIAIQGQRVIIYMTIS
jgi:hypothetical protein